MADTMNAAGALAAHCGSGAWTGIAYGRGEAFWFTVHDGLARRRTADGFGPVVWSDVFELRCFDGGSEVRWWQEELTEGDVAVVTVPEGSTETGPAVTRTWMLWGSADSSDVDKTTGRPWTRLAEARIAPYWAPVTVLHGERAALTVQAVVDVDPLHGNVSVSDEVLTGLGVHVRKER